MRILLGGVAAIALSGCSWLGYTTDGYSTPSAKSSHHGGGTYHQPVYGHQGNHSGENRWTVSGSLGAEIPTGGDMFRGEDSPGAGFNNVAAQDAFDTGFRAELGAAKSLRNNRMVTGHMTYSKAEGQEMNIRNLAGNSVVGTFSDHEAFGVEAGLRQYTKWNAYPNLKPYVEGRLGATKIDDIKLNDVRFAANPAGSGQDYSFIEGGWVPTAAALIGIEKPITRQTMIGIETGIRYNGGLDGDEINPASTGLVNTNDYQERWTVPVSVRGRYRF